MSRRAFVASSLAPLVLPRHVFGRSFPTGLDALVGDALAIRHPQKASYASSAEWPTISSQQHWLAPGASVIAGVPQHTHLDLTFPYAAELGLAPFTVPFSVTLYNGGTITRIVEPWHRVKAWTLDNGATLPLVGNLDGSPRTYTGTVTFDPSIRRTAHGWDLYQLRTTTVFPNGDKGFNTLTLPILSVVDTTQPEDTGRVKRTGALCELREADGTSRWGWNTLEFRELLPILGPISTDAQWAPEAIGWNYNGAPLDGKLADGTVRLLADPDLHNGNPGALLSTATGGSVRLRPTLPGSLPNGPHKLMYQWERATKDGTKTLVSNLVVQVNIGPGGVGPGTTAPPPPSGGGHTTPPPTKPHN